MPEITTFYFQFFGLYLTIACAAWLKNKEFFLAAGEDILNQVGLSLTGSILALILGLVVVLTHNVWEASDAVIITILGYITFLKGASGLLFPNLRRGLFEWIVKSQIFNLFQVVWGILGIYLIYKGFFA